MLFSFIFGGRIPHPSFVLLILSIYLFVVSYKKIKNKKILVGGCWETGWDWGCCMLGFTRNFFDWWL